MVQLVGIAGSLRKQSYNRALLDAAAAQLPAAHRISIADITDFPLYSEDIENEAGIPASVAAVKAAISAADGSGSRAPTWPSCATTRPFCAAPVSILR